VGPPTPAVRRVSTAYEEGRAPVFRGHPKSPPCRQTDSATEHSTDLGSISRGSSSTRLQLPDSPTPGWSWRWRKGSGPRIPFPSRRRGGVRYPSLAGSRRWSLATAAEQRIGPLLVVCFPRAALGGVTAPLVLVDHRRPPGAWKEWNWRWKHGSWPPGGTRCCSPDPALSDRTMDRPSSSGGGVAGGQSTSPT